MKRIFLKPTPLVIDGETLDRKVRKPSGPYLAAEGEEVNLDTYWQRRLNDEEVEEAPRPKAAAAAAPAVTDKSASQKSGT